MTEPAANAISAIISGACRGAVYVVQLRDTSDGCVRFSVGYHNSGATDWVSPTASRTSCNVMRPASS
jgi:hypothetical protein